MAVQGDVHGNVYVGPLPRDPAEALRICRQVLMNASRHLPLRGVDVDASDPGGGGLTVFVLSLIPNPFFDLAGIAAGVLRYPVSRFLFFCWLGNTIKTVVGQTHLTNFAIAFPKTGPK